MNVKDIDEVRVLTIRRSELLRLSGNVNARGGYTKISIQNASFGASIIVKVGKDMAETLVKQDIYRIECELKELGVTV